MSEAPLSHPMTYLFNMTIENEEFPTFWKIFKSVGLYKGKGEREDPASYRPIALLNPLSKLIEMEMLSQIDQFMTLNNLWNKNSFAYRKYHSTTNTLLDIMEIWTQNIDQNTQNINMFLDLSAAFDCVSKSTLLDKLKLYKFDTSSRNLIDSYLSYRSQTISVNGKNSRPLWLKYGLPQGSLLGPIFYNLYTQELSAVVNYLCKHRINNSNNSSELFGNDCKICGMLLNYADDSSIILQTQKNNHFETSQTLDKILNTLEIFLAINNLKLNIEKT